MIKKSVNFLYSFIFIGTLSYAGLVDAVSVIINNSPITLYEIQKYSQQFHISPKEALQILMQEKLENELIKKYGISVDDMEIDDEIEKMSSKANMSIYDFKNYLEKKGINYRKYREDLRKKLLKNKLYKKIAQENIKRVSEKELKDYYNQHIDLYSIPDMIEVIEYDSPDKNALLQITKNPMFNSPNITKKDVVLSSKKLNPKLLYIFQQTKSGNFTPILPLNNQYIAFYIKRKINQKPLPFDKIKNAIYAEIMSKREKRVVRSYFDKLISEANIKTIREPR